MDSRVTRHQQWWIIVCSRVRFTYVLKNICDARDKAGLNWCLSHTGLKQEGSGDAGWLRCGCLLPASDSTCGYIVVAGMALKYKVMFASLKFSSAWCHGVCTLSATTRVCYLHCRSFLMLWSIMARLEQYSVRSKPMLVAEPLNWAVSLVRMWSLSNQRVLKISDWYSYVCLNAGEWPGHGPCNSSDCVKIKSNPCPASASID